MLEFHTCASKVFGRDLAFYSVASECDTESGEYLLWCGVLKLIRARSVCNCNCFQSVIGEQVKCCFSGGIKLVSSCQLITQPANSASNKSL